MTSNMFDNWNEIVDILKTSPKSDKNEFIAVVQNCFRLLGWKRTNGSMIQNFPIDSGICIDIALAYPGKTSICLPIYAKGLYDSNIATIALKKLDCKAFMVIGETIEIYYKDNHNDEVVCVCTVPLSPCNETGASLVNILQAKNFNENSFYSFCQEQAEQILPLNQLQNHIKDLINTPSKLKAIIKDYFINKGFEDELIDNILESLSVSLSYTSAKEPDNNEDVESVNRDNTKFSFDGNNYYSKRIFVLKLIKRYVQDNPDFTLDDLERIFPSEIISKERGIIRPLSTVKEWIKKHPDLEKRYCMKNEEIITLKNGMQVVVYNQWGTHSFPAFLEIAKNLYNIQSDKPYKYEIKKQSRIKISTKSFNTFNKNK